MLRSAPKETEGGDKLSPPILRCIRHVFNPSTPAPFPPTPLAVVDPTQGELPPLQLEPEEPWTDSRSGGGVASRVRSEDAGEVGEEGGQTTVAANEMVSRAVEKAVAWEETGTQRGAEAALTVTGRLLAENPLSVEALHLRGVALYLLGRYVGRAMGRVRHSAVCVRPWKALSDMLVAQTPTTVIGSWPLFADHDDLPGTSIAM